MSILRWDKPKKVMTTQQWAEHYGFDGGPIGGYAPNMSEADQLSWKAKITGKKLGFPQVEIRKTTKRGSQVVIIANLGKGYNYKYYRAVDEDHTQYVDYQDYLQKQGEHYFAQYPKNYNSLQDAITQMGKYCTEEQFWANKYPTKDINVHMATNGPIQMDFAEMSEMQIAVEEAKFVLESFEVTESWIEACRKK